MKVRIFSALTMQEAMNQVKEAMGRDAIILHTRKFRKGGFGGFFGHEMVEVMAAVDDDVPPAGSAAETKKPPVKSKPPVRSLIRPDKPVTAPPPASPPPVLSPRVEVSPEEKREFIVAPVADVPLSIEPLVVDRITSIPAMEEKNLAQVIFRSDRLSEALSGANESAPPPVIQYAPANPAVNIELKNELTGMRQMLEQLLSKTKTTSDNPWYDYLIRKEIVPVFAEHILKGFPHALTMLNKNPDATKKMLYDRLIGYIRPAAEDKVRSACRKLALVGPTGGGKTTTLAKLAARFALEENAGVAFITSDTYRIAAVEQLKTYANILNVPLDVVYSPDEMKKCLNRHKDKQLVLIDTAGRSHYNEEQMLDLERLLSVDEEMEIHLVLNANTAYNDIVEIVERFTGCFSGTVIFTKLDETRNIGNIFNVMYRFDTLDISYITNGQNVPDDIHVAEPNQITDMLMRD